MSPERVNGPDDRKESGIGMPERVETRPFPEADDLTTIMRASLRDIAHDKAENERRRLATEREGR